MYRIFFRGDSRPPEVIFKLGFIPRFPNFEMIQQYNDEGIAYDFFPYTSVCVTPDFDVAALFPKHGGTASFIYALLLDVRQCINGHYHQVVTRIGKHFDADPFLWFAQEHCIGKIKSESIHFCLAINRHHESVESNWHTAYHIHSGKENIGVKMPKNIAINDRKKLSLLIKDFFNYCLSQVGLTKRITPYTSGYTEVGGMQNNLTW